MRIESYSLSDIGKPEDGIVGNSGKTITDMRNSGLSWSEVEDWVTRQVFYDKEVINWARKIYYMEVRKMSIQSSDFNYKYNSRGYEVTFKGQFIFGAGISRDSPNPRGLNVRKNLKDNRKYAEMKIADIISGKDKTLNGAINAISKTEAGS